MKKMLFFTFSLICCLYAEIEIWEYDDSLIQNCIKIKHKDSSVVVPDEVHVVYLDQRRNHYIKIYQPNSRRTASFKLAYERGVFDDVTPLKAILYDRNGMFRGYVSYRCRPLYPYTLIKNKIEELDPTFHDLFLFEKMLELMRKKILETGFYYGDCSCRNLGILNDKCVLFDLDEVIELDELVKIKNYGSVNYYLFKRQELKEIAEEYRKKKESFH